MDGREDTLPAPLILLLDNKDSFVWNLWQALSSLGAAVEVVRSDRIASESLGSAKALVLSPGPGRPEDAGICIQAVAQWSGRLPILGVCLGHQAIAQAFGAKIVRCQPCHGRTSTIRHDQSALYASLPESVAFCRYHSLCVDPRTLPDELIANAQTNDGLVMGLRHRHHPTHGVQFHPESFRSPHGMQLLDNFLQETA